MDMKLLIPVVAAPLALVMSAPAAALGPNVATGSYGNLHWEARSMLVGTGPTNAGHGSTVNTAPMPAFSGTVGLLMGGYVCSGTLLSDHRTILTAAHCVNGVNDDGVTVFFRDPGTDEDVQFYYGGPGYTTVQSSQVFVHGSYTGNVIDHNDIALVRLSQAAPAFADTYDLYTGNLKGEIATVTGYGSTSSIGGWAGVNTVNPNRLGWFRNGDNKLDFRLGDPDFGSVWGAILGEPMSQIEYSYLFDFDNGLAANDTACIVTQASDFGGVPGTSYCDLGVGVREVGVAGGDSGGGSFIDGKVATVNSYGLTFGSAWGDVDNNLNSSYGEFTGVVPVNFHTNWIIDRMVTVPEPATWAMLIIGFGAVGLSARRRRRESVSA